jgi:signal transduction histidine kinase
MAQSLEEAMSTSTLTAHEAVIEALRGVEALRGLTGDEYNWLASNGSERKFEDRAVVFHENDPAYHLSIILKGEIFVRRSSDSLTLFIGRTAQITGLLPFSRMKTWAADGYSAGALWLLDIHKDLFPAMLVAIPSMAQLSVSILLDRVRDFTRADLQAEKLTALGKLAANLSHELNNPAAAAKSAAQHLSEKVDRDQSLCQLGRSFRSDEELANYLAWTKQSLAESALRDLPAYEGSLVAGDHEETLITWLEEHSVPLAWSVAPALAEAGIPVNRLEELFSLVGPEVFPDAVSSFSVSLDTRKMVDTVANSSSRIFHIISAIKDYSYMDQAPIQEIDLRRSLENTLALLNPRLVHVKVISDFDPALPSINGGGAELNQVWTALIENALDAMPSGGTLKITTRRKGEMAFIEIWDDGPGIDPAIVSRIFEPFFTTKPIGMGLGQGLDLVRRVVGKHFGSVGVESEPHSTCFQVRLPLDRPQIY